MIERKITMSKKPSLKSFIPFLILAVLSGFLVNKGSKISFILGLTCAFIAIIIFFFFESEEKTKNESVIALKEVKNPPQPTPLLNEREKKFPSSKKMNSQARNKGDIFEQAFGSEKWK